MKAILISVVVLATVASCKPKPYMGDIPLKSNEVYRVIVNIPGQGDMEYEDKILQYCQFKRLDAMLDNPGAELVEDCFIAEIGS